MLNAVNPLFQFELDELEQQEHEERQSFQVTDLDSLNWVFRKLAAIESKKKDVNALADAEVHRIESYRQKELDKLKSNEEHLQTLVSEYAARRRAEDPKFKTEKTPYGSVGFKKQQPKWNYDDQTLVDWLFENDYGKNLVRTKFEPVKTDIKKLFKVTEAGQVVDPSGQIVEGIQVEHRGDELVIKPEV